jgi:hypothetical protein
MTRHAPGVSFEPRPFRDDLLDFGDPAADFARRFLGLPDPPRDSAPIRANVGLPLEVANALRHAPPGLFASSTRHHEWLDLPSAEDNKRLNLVKRMLGELDAADTEETVRSRRVLQAYCQETFEAGNRRLIDALDWETDAFVPSPRRVAIRSRRA